MNFIKYFGVATCRHCGNKGAWRMPEDHEYKFLCTKCAEQLNCCLKCGKDMIKQIRLKPLAGRLVVLCGRCAHTFVDILTELYMEKIRRNAEKYKKSFFCARCSTVSEPSSRPETFDPTSSDAMQFCELCRASFGNEQSIKYRHKQLGSYHKVNNLLQRDIKVPGGAFCKTPPIDTSTYPGKRR